MRRRRIQYAAMCTVATLVFFSVLAWAQPQAPPLSIPPQIKAFRDAQLQTNALLLYLRVAGLIWIILEWTAAICLWKGYRMLSTITFRVPESAHDRTH